MLIYQRSIHIVLTKFLSPEDAQVACRQTSLRYVATCSNYSLKQALQSTAVPSTDASQGRCPSPPSPPPISTQSSTRVSPVVRRQAEVGLQAVSQVGKGPPWEETERTQGSPFGRHVGRHVGPGMSDETVPGGLNGLQV